MTAWRRHWPRSWLWSALLLVGLLVLGLSPQPAAAETDLDAALRALRKEENPELRIKRIARLQRFDSLRAAKALAQAAREDPVLAVRLAAVKALSKNRAEKAEELLVGLVRFGGPMTVRRAIALEVRGRPKAFEELCEQLDNRRTPIEEAGLIVQTFGWFRDEQSLERLRKLATDPKAPLCAMALRAMFLRTDRRSKRVACLTRLMTTSRDEDTLLTLLDEADRLPDPRFVPAVERLQTYLEPTIRKAAAHTLRQIQVEEAAKKAEAARAAPGQKGKEGDRYAKPEDPPPPDQPLDEPPLRPRFDFVYVMDATGSAFMNIPVLRKRIAQEVELITELGASLRVGLIAYRRAGSAQDPVEVLPLTFDLRRVHKWLDALETRGVDNRGAAISAALHAALDQMDWRRRARRRVRLYADCRAANPETASAVVSIHYREEKTRTSVAYILRTRKSVPSELADLARLGGTGALELMK